MAHLLPPKKPDMIPSLATVDEARFERSDISAVRCCLVRLASILMSIQFGLGDEDAWEDEEEGEFDADHPPDQCHPQ